jgi:glycosyltransferase involved in cell wall biosynthesis
MKISYFLSHPIQYFSPLLRELSKATDLEVCYYSDASIKGQKDKGFGMPIQWDTDLLAGYTAVFVPNYGRKGNPDNHFMDVFNPGVVGVVRKRKGSVVMVNGWAYSSDVLTIFFARMMGRKVWLRAENPLGQELRKNKASLFLKKVILRHIIFPFFIDKCMYIGRESRSFFNYYGVKEDRLIYTPYAVDNAFFSQFYLQWKDKKPELKAELGLPVEKKVILFVGKYTAKKRPMDLLKAFQKLQAPDCVLVMIGEGELRPKMESFIANEGLEKSVRLTGFVNQSQMPRYYAAADVMVMCSGMGETWGLAVNEAMNFATPVIVSNTCGCSSDLVDNGRNGFVFDEGDVNELCKFLHQLLSDDVFRKNAGQRSREIIQEYSIERIVQNIRHAQ